MDQSEAGTRALRALRELGVKLVLDDFGTGYSSLSYLKHLPLDTIKIDRSFVQGLESEDSNLPIVQAVISLAHGLGISVVAEGIETAGQLARLRSLAATAARASLRAARAAAGRDDARQPDRSLPRERPGAGPLAAAAGEAKQEQEDVDEVDVQVDGAEDRRLLDRPERRRVVAVRDLLDVIRGVDGEDDDADQGDRPAERASCPARC